MHAHYAGDTTLVVAVGPLDLARAARLRSVLHTALVEQPARVAIDLSGVPLLDAGAAGVILRAYTKAAAYGAHLRVTGAHSLALEALEILGLAKEFGVYEPRETVPARPDLPCCRFGQAASEPARPAGGVDPPAGAGLPNDLVQRLLTEAVELPENDPYRRYLLGRAIEAALPAAHRFAHRYRSRGEPDDDLLQVAALGLVKAVRRYDPRRGHRFNDFAVPTILGELRRHFRDTGRWVRVPRPLQDLWLDARGVAEELSQRLGRPPSVADLANRLGVPQAAVATALDAARSYAPAGDVCDAEERCVADDPGYERVESWETVRAYLPRLPERTRQILSLRFVDELSQREIAAQLGLSQVHVSRLLTQAYALLRAALVQDRPALGRAHRAGV